MKYLVAFLAVLAVGSVSATPILGSTLGDVVQNVVPTENGHLEQVLCTVLGSLTNNVEIAPILNQLTDAFGIIKGTLGPLVGCVTDALKPVNKLLENVNYFSHTVVNNLEGLLPILDKLVHHVANAILVFLKAVVAVVDKVASELNKDSQDALVALVALPEVLRCVLEIVDRVLKEANKLLSNCGLPITDVFSTLTHALNNVLCAVNGIEKGITCNATLAIRSLSPPLHKIIDALQCALDKVIDAADSLLDSTNLPILDGTMLKL